MADQNERIILYTSNFCGHSWAVEQFIKKHNVPAEIININEESEARATVMAINNGYASVPTLVFPDGSTLTEPSFQILRQKLGIEHEGILDKIRGLFS